MTEDLERYIRSSQSSRSKLSETSSKQDSESIDTADILSDYSDFSDIRRPAKVKPSRQKLNKQRSTQKPLRPVDEEEESYEYKLSDYLPRPEADYKVSSKHQRATRKLSKDADTRSNASSVDTDALLNSSDEEVKDDELQVKWRPKEARRSSDSKSAANVLRVGNVLETLRSKKKNVGYPKPPVWDYRPVQLPSFEPTAKDTAPLRRDYSEPSFRSYSRPEPRDPPAYSSRSTNWSASGYSARDLQEVSFRPHSQNSQPASKPPKPISLGYTTQQASIVPQSRLQLASVLQVSIQPSPQPRVSEFSLLDHLQSPRTNPRSPDQSVRGPSLAFSYSGDALMSSDGLRRSAESLKEEQPKVLQVCTCILAGQYKTHLPDCRATTVTALIPSEASAPPVPSRPAAQKKKPRLSILEAVVLIQRTVRRFLRNRSSPIREHLTWSPDHSQAYRPTVKRQPAELPDSDRATQSLFNALDQLRALKEMASNSSSEETSFVLSESLVSREMSVKAEVPVELPRDSDTCEAEIPVRASPKPQSQESSVDTDLLLRSSDTLEF